MQKIVSERLDVVDVSKPRHSSLKINLLYAGTCIQFLFIFDAGEVEYKLRLLQELVPEWICEKPSSFGNLERQAWDFYLIA